MRKLLFLLAIVFMTICMLLFPEAAYQGASNGIRTWVVHLLPALLPFFIVANLLFSLGFVRFLGVLLEPIMRPVFRLPGEAGFALALGFTSGFPMGAILTTSLCEQNLCTDEEAARLAAFTNNSSPLFLLTAVPVSMLHAPELGILLISAHYPANLTIGILCDLLRAKRNLYILSPMITYCAMHLYNCCNTKKNILPPLVRYLGKPFKKVSPALYKSAALCCFFLYCWPCWMQAVS